MCDLSCIRHKGSGVVTQEAHSALVILGPIIREGVAVAHVLSAIAGVDGQLVLCRLVPQMHHVPQVCLQLLQQKKH